MRKDMADEKLQLLNKLLVGIKTGLEALTTKMFLGKGWYCLLVEDDNDQNDCAGDGLIPGARNSMESMAVCQSKLNRIMERIGGSNILGKKLEMEEADFEPVGLGVVAEGLLEDEKVRLHFPLPLLFPITITIAISHSHYHCYFPHYH